MYLGTDIDDYPNLKDNAEVAAAELDRLSALCKILWYPVDKVPHDLCGRVQLMFALPSM